MAKRTALLSEEPTESELHSACLSFRHDFGLLPDMKKREIMLEAKAWHRAWWKSLGDRPS